MDHRELIAEMAYIEKLSTQERLKLARRRRLQQLKKCGQSDTSASGGGVASKREKTILNEAHKRNRDNRAKRVVFVSSIMLLEAAARNDIEEVRQLLQLSGVSPNATNEDGLTALHQCCIDDSAEMLTLLLQHGAAVNAADSEKWTPLHAAATCGHLHLAKILVQHGANLLAVNADGNMPYDICEDDATLDYIECQMAQAGVTQAMIDDTRTTTETAMLHEIGEMKANGEALLVRDSQNATPLHIASANGYLRVATLLLNHNFPTELRDADDWTPLHAAACWGHPDVLELLVQHGASLHARNKNNETPYDICEDLELRERMIQLLTEQETKRSAGDQRRVRRGHSANTRTQSVRRTSVRERGLTAKKEAQGEARMRLLIPNDNNTHHNNNNNAATILNNTTASITNNNILTTKLLPNNTMAITPPISIHSDSNNTQQQQQGMLSGVPTEQRIFNKTSEFLNLSTDNLSRSSREEAANKESEDQGGNHEQRWRPTAATCDTNQSNNHNNNNNNLIPACTDSAVTSSAAPVRSIGYNATRNTSGVSNALAFDGNKKKEAESDYGGAFYSNYSVGSSSSQDETTEASEAVQGAAETEEIYYDDSVNSGYSDGDLVRSHFGASLGVDVIKNIEEFAATNKQASYFSRQLSNVSSNTSKDLLEDSNSKVKECDKMSTTTFPSVVLNTNTTSNPTSTISNTINTTKPTTEAALSELLLQQQQQGFDPEGDLKQHRPLDIRLRPDGAVKRQAPLPNVASSVNGGKLSGEDNNSTTSNPIDCSVNKPLDVANQLRFEGLDESIRMNPLGHGLFGVDDNVDAVGNNDSNNGYNGSNNIHMTSTEDSVVPLLDPQPDLIPESVRRKPPKPAKPASLVSNFRRNSQAGVVESSNNNNIATIAAGVALVEQRVAISRSSSNSDSSGATVGIKTEGSNPRPVPPPRTSSVKSNADKKNSEGNVQALEIINQQINVNDTQEMSKDLNQIDIIRPGNNNSSRYNTYDSSRHSNGIDIHVTVTVKPLAPGTLADLKQQRSLNRGGGGTTSYSMNAPPPPPIDTTNHHVGSANVATGEYNKAYVGAEAEIIPAVITPSVVTPAVRTKYRPPPSPSLGPQRFHGEPSEYPAPEESRPCCVIL